MCHNLKCVQYTGLAYLCGQLKRLLQAADWQGAPTFVCPLTLLLEVWWGGPAHTGYLTYLWHPKESI